MSAVGRKTDVRKLAKIKTQPLEESVVLLAALLFFCLFLMHARLRGEMTI